MTIFNAKLFMFYADRKLETKKEKKNYPYDKAIEGLCDGIDDLCYIGIELHCAQVVLRYL